ncbi:HD domain-containing protein [Spiroplasma endosymbiont of Crioceris asparagi]|uniref:HD domain-containing protein n=1 Tax=Spiroplasma endosymbiont of Crioceris asparagi TaxID=3066286 RepID=UPI0030D53305
MRPNIKLINLISKETILLSSFIVIFAIAIIVFFVLIVFILHFIKLKKPPKKQATQIYKNIINSAKNKAKDIINEAEERRNFLLNELSYNKKIIEENKLIVENEKNRYKQLNADLTEVRNNLESAKILLDEDKKNLVSTLENLANISKTEIKAQLEKHILSLYKEEFNEKIKVLEDTNKAELNHKARNLILDAMQDVAVDSTETYNLTFMDIDSEDLKGRIIGKEGRNIKAFQHYGGVDIIIDDSTTKIGISSFNPIRREVALRTLKKLLKLGRLQPVLIEEEIQLQNKFIEEEIYDIGEKTIAKLDLDNVSKRLTYLLGRLHFRTSYGQNVLVHSIEVAQLCGKIALELGLDPRIAKKAGLFHDIGKAVDSESEMTHVQIGAQELKNANELSIIINAVEAHHGDVEKQSPYAEIVVIADTLSAARTGARNNDIGNFITRMREVEEECKKVNGVMRVFALQSGRQIRVIVDPKKVSDLEMKIISEEIKNVVKRINKTPGKIVVTIIREKIEIVEI